MRTLLSSCAVAATLASAGTLLASGPTFRPNVAFTGSTLAAFRPVGDATWTAVNGEITGTPKSPAGGWLVLDKPYQDVGLYASFRCAAGCRAGLLFRAERTPDGGMKGVFVSLNDDIASYAVTIDARGRETSRDRLRPGGGQMRIAPPPSPTAAAAAPGGSAGAGRAAGPAVPLPIVRPDLSLKGGAWNSIEVMLDANIIRAFLNPGGSETAGGVIEGDASGFGPIALYVGGTAEVTYKDLAWRDLNLHTRVTERTAAAFRKQQVSDFYYSWGAGAGDFNRDGVLDIVSGPHVFLGPRYDTRREIYLQIATNPSDDYPRDAWMQFAGEFTNDGWDDALNCSFSGSATSGAPGCYVYVNPHNEPRRWTKIPVLPAFQTEIAVVRDVNGDGKLDVAYGAQNQVRWAERNPANPLGPWIEHNVSQVGFGNAHGMGVGDVNGDGRLDILNAFGWWEQPAAPSAATWTHHPEAFGRYGRNGVGGSVMAVYDVNGDALNDVVTVLNAHGFGLAWFEQTRDAGGRSSFVQHMIMDDYGTKNAGDVTFSEPHGSAVADMTGDGLPDFVVGKRYWAHRDDYLDPDPYGPAVLYVYKTVRNRNAPGGAEFVPELVNNHSGTGSDVLAVDLNKDGRMDLVSATRFGTFIFWGQSTARR